MTQSPGWESRRLAFNVLAGGSVNIIKIGLQLVMLPVMAHLLGPAEFGVYALAMPTVAFFMTLADGGLGSSLAREPLESKVIWSTAFWLLLMVGFILAAITVTWGFVLAQLSEEPRVTGVMALLSVTFVLVTASVLPSAKLIQERRLAVISGADLAGALSGAATAFALALSGAGAMSLAAQTVVTYFVRSIVLNAIAFIRPNLTFQPSALTSHISTGSSLVSGRLADFSGRLIENLAFTRVFDSAALGAFSFSNLVPRFVSEAVSNPIWAALYAQGLRERDPELMSLYRKFIEILALVLAPVAFITSASASSIVQLTLGEAWQQAGPMLSIIFPFAALNAVVTLSGSLLLARGKGWSIFWLTLVLAISRVVAVAFGYWFGILGVAWGIGLTQIVYTFLSLYALQRIGMPSTQILVRGLLTPTLAAMAGGLVCYLLVQTAPLHIFNIAIAITFGGVAYVSIIALVLRQKLILYYKNIKSMLRR